MGFEEHAVHMGQNKGGTNKISVTFNVLKLLLNHDYAVNMLFKIFKKRRAWPLAVDDFSFTFHSTCSPQRGWGGVVTCRSLRWWGMYLRQDGESKKSYQVLKAERENKKRRRRVRG